MPQMAPIMWLSMLLATFFSVILISMFLYFQNNLTGPAGPVKLFEESLPLNWKW